MIPPSYKQKIKWLQGHPRSRNLETEKPHRVLSSFVDGAETAPKELRFSQTRAREKEGVKDEKRGAGGIYDKNRGSLPTRASLRLQPAVAARFSAALGQPGAP